MENEERTAWQCPDCDNTDAYARIEKTERVPLTTSGQPREFIPFGDSEIKEIRCGECDNTITSNR